MENTDQESLRQDYAWNERFTVFVQHLLICLMLACALVSIVRFGRFLVPSWNGAYLVPVIFLLCLEAMLTQRLVRRAGFLSGEWLRYRLAEWVVLLVGLKLVIYLVRGFDRLLADMAQWRDRFVETWFSGEYLFAVSMAVLFWGLAGIFAEELAQLEGDERLLQIERESGITTERPAVRRSLAGLVLLVGGVMIFLEGLMRLSGLGLFPGSPSPQGGVWNILAFFILALVLLALTQFSILRVFWSLERIPIGSNLGSRWLLFSALFLAGLALLVLLLPTQYSLGLLDVLAFLLGVLGLIGGILLLILFAPLILIWFALSFLFGRSPRPDLSRLPEMIPQPQPPATGEGWSELLKSILFWALFLGVIGYSLYHYISQNQELLDALRRLPLAGAVLRFLRQLRDLIRGVNQSVGQGIQAGLRRLRARRGAAHEAAAWRYTSLRRLTPRQRVLFFYLAMLRRGGEQGLPRHPAQTPYEYARELGGQVPDVEQEVAALTEEFIEARYSRHDITEEDVGLVQGWWQRIKHALRGR